MIRKFVAALSALALASCASSGVQTAEPQFPPGPALYVARDADSTVYIFGTLHIRRPNEEWGGSGALDGEGHFARRASADAGAGHALR